MTERPPFAVSEPGPSKTPPAPALPVPLRETAPEVAIASPDDQTPAQPAPLTEDPETV